MKILIFIFTCQKTDLWSTINPYSVFAACNFFFVIFFPMGNSFSSTKSGFKFSIKYLSKIPITVASRKMCTTSLLGVINKSEIPLLHWVAWFSFSFCSVKKYGIYILLTISTTHDKIFCSHRITTWTLWDNSDRIPGTLKFALRLCYVGIMSSTVKKAK